MKTLFLISLLMTSGCNSWLQYYQDDNFIEEAVEEVIEEKTDIPVDLTPWSPEE